MRVIAKFVVFLDKGGDLADSLTFLRCWKRSEIEKRAYTEKRTSYNIHILSAYIATHATHAIFISFPESRKEKTHARSRKSRLNVAFFAPFLRIFRETQWIAIISSFPSPHPPNGHARFRLCVRLDTRSRRSATIRRRETGAMLLSLGAIYFLRRRCACESNVPAVRGRRS